MKHLRVETQNIINDLELVYPGPQYEGHRDNMLNDIQKAEAKYQYEDEYAKRGWGSAAEIKEELAQEYCVCVDTITTWVTKV